MKNFFSARLIKAGLIVGTLDILGACTYYYIKTGKNPLTILKFVASGVFGKTAFESGNIMLLWGLIFHFFIAFSFTIFFFWIFSKIPALSKNRILTGIVYGIFIWTVMQFLVVPLSKTAKSPFNLTNAIIGASILIVCIGIPLSLMAKNATVNNPSRYP
jgi:uncharacterized membrane protein YagU involved in acid resistance